jgi:hypothetical protein
MTERSPVRPPTARIVAITSLATGALAPLVYLSTAWTVDRLGISGDWPAPASIALSDVWTVAPGAALIGGRLCLHLCRHRLSWRTRLWLGAVLGALLGVLNVPLTGLTSFLRYSRFGTLPDGLYNLMWSMWVSAIGVVIAWPVYLPCGALLGFCVGALTQIQLRGLGRDDP